MSKEHINFGEHIMIDGYGVKDDKLENFNIVLDYIEKIVEMSKMRKLGEPIVYRVKSQDNNKDDGGLSGFVVVVESHVSVHTFKGRGFVTIDVYTCRNGLPVERIKEFTKEYWKLEDIEFNFVKRGLKYPKYAVI